MDVVDDLVPDISVVIPCLDEAANVAPIVAAVAAELTKAEVSYEIILIDNGSTDGTLDLIRALCAEDKRVRLIANNRNYGQMRSPTYGIYQASGRAVIGMCADFQDPPELLGQFIARWRAGVRIVLGVRESERASVILQVVRAVGYGYLERFGDYKIIPGATGFGLYDRQVVDCLSSWREPEPFFRGMLVESGYSARNDPLSPAPPGRRSVEEQFLHPADLRALSALAVPRKRLLRAPLYLAAAAMVATMLYPGGEFDRAVPGTKALGDAVVRRHRSQLRACVLLHGSDRRSGSPHLGTHAQRAPRHREGADQSPRTSPIVPVRRGPSSVAWSKISASA